MDGRGGLGSYSYVQLGNLRQVTALRLSFNRMIKWHSRQSLLLAQSPNNAVGLWLVGLLFEGGQGTRLISGSTLGVGTDVSMLEPLLLGVA